MKRLSLAYRKAVAKASTWTNNKNDIVIIITTTAREVIRKHFGYRAKKSSCATWKYDRTTGEKDSFMAMVPCSTGLMWNNVVPGYFDENECIVSKNNVYQKVISFLCHECDDVCVHALSLTRCISIYFAASLCIHLCVARSLVRGIFCLFSIWASFSCVSNAYKHWWAV